MKKILIILSIACSAFNAGAVSSITFEKSAPNKIDVYLVPDFTGTNLQMYDMTMNIGVPTTSPAPPNSNVSFQLSPAMSAVWPASNLQSNGATLADKPGNTIYYRQWYNGAPTATQVFSLTSGTRFLIGTWVFNGPLPVASNYVTMYDNADGGLASGFTQLSFSVVLRGDVLPHTSSPFVQNTATSVGTDAPTSSVTTTLGASTPNDYAMRSASVVALPLSLVSFNATRKDASSAELKWITTEEKDMDYFEVERSADGSAFAGVATRVKANNRIGENSYTVDDNNVIKGDNYYRLKMVGINGNFRYSEVRKLNFAVGKGYSLRPVPANDFVVVTGTTPGAKVKLMSLSGQMIAEVAATANATRIALDQVAAGTYYVQVVEGEQIVYNTKLIKQ